MRIAHVSVGALPEVFSRFGGAIQRRVAELALEQARRGHHVEVFSPGTSGRTVDCDGVVTHYLRCRLGQPLAHIEFQGRVAAALRRRTAQVDVLHFHSEPEGAVLAARWAGATVLSYDNYFFRGVRSGKGSNLFPVYRKALERFDALLPCSDYCRDESLRYWTLPAERAHRIYNGVSTDQFRPDPESGAAERLRLGVDGPVVLYLGRICRQKGTDTLLAAHEEVRRRRPDVELLVAGPVDQFDAQQPPGNTAGWETRIAEAGGRYLGRVPDDRLRGLYNAADVFVMPTAELEMFGMAVVEAQACGTPAVASDHGGLRETVPLEAGRRFPVGDVNALATAILATLDEMGADPALPSRARDNAERFAWPEIVTELSSVYEYLIDSADRQNHRSDANAR